MRSRILAGLLLALPLAAPARAQTQDYEAMFGPPVDVSIDDLLQNPESYERRAVRTRSRIEVDINTTPGSGMRRGYVLRGMIANGSVRIVPMPEVAARFEDEAPVMIGRELEVTGAFVISQQVDAGTAAGGMGPTPYVIQFWGYVGPEQNVPKDAITKATQSTLASLVTHPGSSDGKTVRVVGKFRGRNLYGDLPSKSERSSADWVIKDDLFAVWVTGKKPKGSGWALDGTLKRDTNKWIEVVGKPETRGGVTYLRALQVSLSGPPTPTAEAQAPPPPPPKPRVPPVVVFSLPLDGEGDVAPDARFVVQFNNDMDETSFLGHVQLRYAGPPRPGDRNFDGMRLSYDGGLRALTVDPGDILRSGRKIELLLLPGIADMDGLALVSRTGRETEGMVDILRFDIGG
jgi:Big-like domain-containing protein